MIAQWPTDLPLPERDTWQKRPQEARRKSQSDAGPPSYRRRFTSVPRLVSLSVLLNRDQRAVFEHFFQHDCAEGARLFRMPDPTTDGRDLLSSDGFDLLAGAGAQLLLGAIWLCAWGDALPAETLVGSEFRQSFDVVVMP